MYAAINYIMSAKELGLDIEWTGSLVLATSEEEYRLTGIIGTRSEKRR